jgi:hypothetical protein
MTQYTSKHITTSGTITVVDKPCFLLWLAVIVTLPGTTWTIRVNNREGTPEIIYMNTGTGVSVGPDYVHFPEKMLMRSGINIVTAGTAGAMDVFMAYQLTEHQ